MTLKRKNYNIIWIVIVSLLMVGIVAFYIYDVFWQKTPYLQNLFRAVSIFLVLLGTLFKLVNGMGRKGLDVYEKAFENEIGRAFENKPINRKKLLCACRLYDESNYTKALKYLFDLLRVSENKNDAVTVLLFTALCYTNVGVTDEAIRTYYEIIRIDPDNARAHSNVGLLLAESGDYEGALRHYDRAIEIMPKNYYAYTNRANYYFRKGDYDNAVFDAHQALEYKNNGVEAASLLTVIYALKGDEQNKSKYYHISITAGKDPQELNQAIQYFLSEQNIPSDENL